MTTHEVGDPPQQEMKKTSLVQNLVREQDGRVIIEEIANKVEIAHGLAFSILAENIGLSKLSVGTVGSKSIAGTATHPKSLTFFTNFGKDGIK
nr:hypothetical protein HmN_000704000 [Hymenolepis microstoma]